MKYTLLAVTVAAIAVTLNLDVKQPDSDKIHRAIHDSAEITCTKLSQQLTGDPASDFEVLGSIGQMLHAA